MQHKLREVIAACDELIARMQAGDQDAIDASRGLLWRWVDEGKATELINLLGAIRLLHQVTLEHLEGEDEDLEG